MKSFLLARLLFSTFWTLAACLPAADLTSPTEAPASSSARLGLGAHDDRRFSMKYEFGDVKLPATQVYLNAVELSARYAEMDFLGRAGIRQGIVLPQYPQVEIAVIPAPPARSVEVRLVIWAMYGAILEMAFGSGFNECEIEILWEDRLVAHLYFTGPDDSVLRSRIRNVTAPIPGNTTAVSNAAPQPVHANIGAFSWKPIYKPRGEMLNFRDIFILILGGIKVVAIHRMDEKVDGPSRIGSDIIGAHIQIYLQDRRVPRNWPPYFQYAHVLQALRRIPAWMLDRRKFAEFFCSIESSMRPVGMMFLEKGYQPALAEADGNVTVA
ncbi:MAG: hypothetical protein Q9173_004464 [Seirophora scorigena]